MTSPTSQTLISLLISSPLLLVFMAGMIVSLVLMKKHPRVSVASLVGFLILSLATVFNLAVNYFFSARTWGLGSDPILYYRISGAFFILVRTVGYVFLGLAIFMGRPSKPGEYNPDRPEIR